MRVISLESQNIKRLTAVQITPTGTGAIVIAGENENGKSSVIDSIQMALGGKDAIPPKPVHGDAEKGSVTLALGDTDVDFVVRRTFTAAGGSSLTVTNKEGTANYKSPQALLDGFAGSLTFDPLAFVDFDAAKQNQVLRTLAKVNTDDIDLERKRLYDERTLENRELARLKGVVDSAPKADVPVATMERLSMADVLAELKTVDDAAAVAREASVAADRATTNVVATKRTYDEAVDRVATLEADLAKATLHVAKRSSELEDASTAAGIAKDYADQCAARVPDRSVVAAKLTTIEAHNKRADEIDARLKALTQHSNQASKVTALGSAIDSLDTKKAELLSSAKFPLEGLGISDTGVTWQGLPFEQASTAVKTQVSMAICAALNPKLKIALVRGGNDLDTKHLHALAESAEAHGVQVWIERIAGGEGLCTVVIQDGEVAS